MKDQKKNQPKNRDGHNPSQMPHKSPKASAESPDKHDQPSPGKEPRIDDDPDQTMKKIPVEKATKRES